MKKWLSSRTESFYAFWFSLALLIGGAYNMYVHYDYSYAEDSVSYTNMAQGDFYNTSLTHRYRFIVPVAAMAVSQPVKLVYDKIWHRENSAQFAVRFSFFLVNLLLMSTFGMFLFKIIRSCEIDILPAFIVLSLLLTTRWGLYAAGLPMVESLYLLSVSILIYSILQQNKTLFLGSILLGAFAKEAFVFFLPLILYFNFLNKKAQLWGWLGIVAGLVFGSRLLIDSNVEYINTPFPHPTPNTAPFIWLTATYGKVVADQIWNFARHFYNIIDNLKIALTPKGIGETFSAIGIAIALIFVGLLGGKTARQLWISRIPTVLWWVFGACIVQALLGEWGRMLYYAAPFYAVSMGLILTHHPYFEAFRKQTSK